MADALRSVLIFPRSKDTVKPVTPAEVADAATAARQNAPDPRSDAAKIELIRKKLEDGSLDRVLEKITPQEQTKPAIFLVQARRDAIVAKRHAGVTDRAIAEGIARELGGILSAHTLRQAIKKLFGPNGRCRKRSARKQAQGAQHDA